MENFYRPQAAGYDRFRKHLLQGRAELATSLNAPDGGVWVDLGAGTGANLDFAGDTVPRLKEVILVDLSPSMLRVAEQRIAQRKWSNVRTVLSDATRFQPPGSVDVVTFSYALTMIPNWFAAIDQAFRILKPGGIIGVVDFFVSRKHPERDRARHSWLTRTLLPIWFASDNVFPSADHVAYLEQRFETVGFSEHRAKLPYLPFVRAPYYLFTGRKPLSPTP